MSRLSSLSSSFLVSIGDCQNVLQQFSRWIRPIWIALFNMFFFLMFCRVAELAHCATGCRRKIRVFSERKDPQHTLFCVAIKVLLQFTRFLNGFRRAYNKSHHASEEHSMKANNKTPYTVLHKAFKACIQASFLTSQCQSMVVWGSLGQIKEIKTDKNR